MPGYRAKFIGGLRVKPDAKITLTLCVSMNCVQQTGEQFAAFLGLVVKHSAKISRLQIIISDDLYRHYSGWTSDTSDEERRTMADRDYSKWMDEDLRYLSFFRDVGNVFAGKEKISISESEANRIFGLSLAELQCAKTIEFEIVRWRSLVETPEYAAAKAAVDKAFVEIPALKSVIEEVAKSHCEKRGVTLESAMEFLKEEIAVTAGQLKKREVAYPSVTLNAAITYALRDIFHDEVFYHGYSIEPRGRQPLLVPVGVPADISVAASVGVSAELLRSYIQTFLSACAEKKEGIQVAELELGDGPAKMKIRFQFGDARERSRSLILRVPDNQVVAAEPRPASSPK